MSDVNGGPVVLITTKADSVPSCARCVHLEIEHLKKILEIKMILLKMADKKNAAFSKAADMLNGLNVLTNEADACFQQLAKIVMEEAAKGEMSLDQPVTQPAILVGITPDSCPVCGGSGVSVDYEAGSAVLECAGCEGTGYEISVPVWMDKIVQVPPDTLTKESMEKAFGILEKQDTAKLQKGTPNFPAGKKNSFSFDKTAFVVQGDWPPPSKKIAKKCTKCEGKGFAGKQGQICSQCEGSGVMMV